MTREEVFKAEAERLLDEKRETAYVEAFTKDVPVRYRERWCEILRLLMKERGYSA